MATHLGPGLGEVHDAADELLDYWFGTLGPDDWFAKNIDVDRTCAVRFGSVRNDVLDNDALGWRSEPETMLAAIILLDQISRNIHRGTAEAFAADPLALSLSYEAIERGWVGEFPADHAQFLLMPLMHAEHSDAQADSIRQFTALGDAKNLKFAQEHKAVFDRFGRFPSRNEALGRGSTEDELDYLSQPDAGW